MNPEASRETQLPESTDWIRVSICTVTYERQPLLRLLEACLCEQEYPATHLEWVIIDDSPSRMSELAFSRARERGIQVNYIHLDARVKLGEKRNMSHAHCSGEIIINMDDDDYYPPSRVVHSVQALQKSNCLIAGCSELPLLILPECSTWMVHALGPNHATANTFAFRREYLDNHRYDPGAMEAEESSFLNDFSEPMVQLEPFQTVTCVGHSRNTVDKRRFITSTQGSGVSRIFTANERFAPSEFISHYRSALAEIERKHNHAIVTGNQSAESEAEGSAENGAERPRFKVAIITPYYQEDISILRRCHRSVKDQTIACTHFMIADGDGLDSIEEFNCRHIRLGGQGHADNGNTPRSVGALCAMNEGYTCIAYLDADNWFLPNHIADAIDLHETNGCEVVFTEREIAFPDGEVLPQQDDEDLDRSHVDTSSIVVFESAFRSLSIWAQMPRELGPFCDRVAFSYLTSHFRCGWTSKCSVVFETWYWGHFTAAGRLVPANAKFLPSRSHEEWLDVSKRFRQRSHTPFLPAGLPTSPGKIRINLISILGPLGSGGYQLQRLICKHIAFFGMPANNFLYRWKAGIGDDCDERYMSEEALGRLDALDRKTKNDPDWRLLPLVSPALALTAGRSFNLLEAYFRLVQATMPSRARDFGKSSGVANVIDRTSSSAYAADLLFEILPMHRAILVVSEPETQITQVYKMQRKRESPRAAMQIGVVHELCRQYLDALITPLQAAPEQQLMVVRREAFNADPEKHLRAVIGWLGHGTSEWPESLRRRIDTGGAINLVYSAELEKLEKQIDREIAGSTAEGAATAAVHLDDWERILAAEAEETTQPSTDEENLIQAITDLFSPLQSIFDGNIELAEHEAEAEPVLEIDNNEDVDPHEPVITKDPTSIESLMLRVEILSGLLKTRLQEPGEHHIWMADPGAPAA